MSIISIRGKPFLSCWISYFKIIIHIEYSVSSTRCSRNHHFDLSKTLHFSLRSIVCYPDNTLLNCNLTLLEVIDIWYRLETTCFTFNSPLNLLCHFNLLTCHFYSTFSTIILFLNGFPALFYNNLVCFYFFLSL